MNISGGIRPVESNVACVFPGQGSQQVGMGKDLLDNFKSVREIFAEIDDALNFPLSRLMFQGPEDELTKTMNAQPAILAASLAAWVAIQETLGTESMPKPSLVAGHSLGEYTALVISGVLNVSDAAKLVRARGNFMQTAAEEIPGSMAAILGLDEQTVDEICRETGAQISNVNTEDQMVIAGDLVALARAMDLATVRGAKRLIRLQVGGAFHSRLMLPAEQGMRETLQEYQFNDPIIPIIGNVSGRPLLSAKSVKAELIRQLCSCVQWKRSVSYMIGAGVGMFYEIGPGKVLSSLIKRAYPDMPVVNLNNPESIYALSS